MKRIVLGVVAFVSLVVVAACGGPAGGLGPECEKYLACSVKLGGTYETSAKTTYGPDSTCAKEPSVKEACESGCTAGLPGLSSGFTDGGSC